MPYSGDSLLNGKLDWCRNWKAVPFLRMLWKVLKRSLAYFEELLSETFTAFDTAKSCFFTCYLPSVMDALAVSPFIKVVSLRW